MDLLSALAAAEPEVTPVAVCDEAAMEHNLERMARLAAISGLALRPHAKTHKSPYVAERQLDHGAVGLTAATLTEAESFAAAGAGDLLLAHPPVGQPKLRRLAALTERVRRLAVATDDAGVALSLPDRVDVLWEVDSGLHRVGTPPGPATADAIAGLLGRGFDARRLRGLLTHAGHAYGGDREAAARDEWEALVATAAALRSRGIDARELSVGSTPTAGYAREAARAGVTEMRPGTYVYGDANQVMLGSQALEECALGIVATVVSSHRDRFVVDAGSKALSADLRVRGLEGFGIVLGRPELTVARLSEEHAVIEGGGAQVGERLVIIPAHVCTAVNLHPQVLFFGPRGRHWVPTVARGWQPPES